MSSGADLFVICKQCGAEVSPYITECPYCGSRLRKRAPNLPRDRLRRSLARSRRPFAGWSLRRGGELLTLALEPPLMTAILVLAALVVWIVWEAGGVHTDRLIIYGPLHRAWWRLLIYQFAYPSSSFSVFLYGATTLTAIAVFGSAVEQRYGPMALLALFFFAGIGGGLAALAIYPRPLLIGGEAGSLALLGAWLVPELTEARQRGRAEADLIGALAFAFVLAVMPFAVEGASWTAALVGGALGTLCGSGLAAVRTRV